MSQRPLRIGGRVLALAVAAVLAVLAAVAGGSGALAAAKDDLTLGAQLEPPNLDPTLGASVATDEVVYANVFEGLVRIGPDGGVRPGLAESWDISPDGLIYVFHLRRGVRFHDGAPFDAATAKFALDRARAPTSPNAQRPQLAAVRAVEAVDPATLRVTLSRPDGGLLDVLGWGGLVMVAPNSIAGAAARPVGTGPFRFAGWRRGDSIVLTRNPDYWGRPAPLARVTFKFISDPTAALAALKAGDVDAFPYFPAPESLAQLKSDPRFKVTVGATEGETLMAMNQRRPPLNDLRVRRALSYAIDRKAVIEGAMFGYGEPIGSHFSPRDPGYVDLTGRYPHDPARARALLAEAGYRDGLSLTMKLPPTGYARRSGEILAAQLAQVGVRVRLENLEWAQWLEQVFKNHQYDLTVVSHTEPKDYDIYGRPDYYFGYDSPPVRALLAQLDATREPPERLRLLGLIQRQIADDAVNGFLFEFPKLGVWRADLDGLWTDAPIEVNDLTQVRFRGAAAAGPAPSAAAPILVVAAGGVAALAAAALVGLALFRAGPAYAGRRLAILVLTLLGASLVVFAVTEIAPGDPASFMMGLNANPQGLASLRAELGLDQPAPARYLAWLAGMAHGDFGLSYTYRTPVADLILERLQVSLPLALYALALAAAFAFPAAVVAAANHRRTVDRAIGGLTQLGVAAPNFWLAMLLVLVFAVGLHWTSAGGFPGWREGLWPGLKALTLPAIALAAPQAAVLTRVLRAALVDTLSQDYMRTARARGLSRLQALWRHGLPNALVPTLTVLGLQISFLLAGGVIIETVFFLPGLGRLVFQAIAQRDLIVVQGVVMTLVLAVAVTNFVVDLAYGLVDPRLRGDRR